MAKTLQFRRGTTSELSSQAGAVGELFVDTDKDTVVVMDGSTTGGFPLAKESAIPSATSDLTNDSGFITSSALTGYATESYVDTAVAGVSVDLTGYATETYVNAQGFITTSALSGYVTSSQLITGLSLKQDTLVSGTNIKSINGTTLLGSGDISVSEYTDTDARNAISVAGGSSALSYDSSTGEFTFTNPDTDAIEEGSTNLYYTDARVSSYLSTNSYATLDNVNQGLAGKQETLESGTNIKTINGVSILGSGDISSGDINVPTATSDLMNDSGFITSSALIGYITSSELITGLSLKQDTLQSGTNIKTINGTSLLGSGDITISSGAGATITDDTTTNATYYPTMSSTSSGSFSTAYVTSTKYYFNPSTGTLNSTNFNSLSDVTLKKNICTIENASNIVKQLRGVEFEWIDTGIKSSGVIAQELEVVLPHLVTETEGGTKTVNYSGIIAYLIQANSELLQRIEILERNK